MRGASAEGDAWGAVFRELDFLLLSSPEVQLAVPERLRHWLLRRVKERLHAQAFDRGLTLYLPISRIGPDDLVP